MDSKSFKRQVLPYADRIYPMVARMLGGHENAEDAVQEIMIKLWKNRKRLSEHPNLGGFVFRTAKNYCIDTYRKNQMVMQPFDSIPNEKHQLHDPDELEWKELNTFIRQLLAELPANQAEVLQLRDLDGLEFDEIASLLDLKVDHVRVLLSRARKKMSEKIKTIYNYEYREKRSAAS